MELLKLDRNSPIGFAQNPQLPLYGTLHQNTFKPESRKKHQP
ncbi:hypothetical protein [Microcoleus sp. F4-D5]